MRVEPIKASDIETATVAQDLATMDQITTKINNTIKERYGTVSVITVGADGVNARVRQKVISAFAEAGWQLTFQTDEREGASFSIRRK